MTTSSQTGGSTPCRANVKLPKLRPCVKLTYFCAAIILFNFIYGSAMFIILPGFAQIVTEYFIFFGLYAISGVAVIFGLKDRKHYLIYPYLVLNICVSIICALVFTFHLTNTYYCAVARSHPNITLTTIHDHPYGATSYYYDCTLVSSQVKGWAAVRMSARTAMIFLFLALEKFFEYMIFRKLQKVYRQAEAIRRARVITVPLEQPTIQVVDVLRHQDNIDSDDDLIIYDRTSRNLGMCEYPNHPDPPFATDHGLSRGSRTIA